MSYRKVNDNSLASVADAIRSKGGTSNALVFPDGFVSAISAIQTGGGSPSRQAKLTITSTAYTGNCYGAFFLLIQKGIWTCWIICLVLLLSQLLLKQ